MLVALGVAVATAAAWLWRARAAEPTLDPTTIPSTIARELPCAARCRVTFVGVLDAWFAVSVESEEVAGRTLDYRVYPTGAVLGLEQDGLNMPSLDLGPVDWKLVRKLRDELEDRAVSGQRVQMVRLRPCTFTNASPPVKACFEAEVLTSSGQLRRVLDAATGEIVDER